MPLGAGHTAALRLLENTVAQGSTVVDAGALPGHLTTFLAKRWKVLALDADPDRGWTAQERYHAGIAQGGEISFRQVMAAKGIDTLSVDIERDAWPVESSSADAVVLTEVIEHLYADPIHALLEANRILRTGGVLLVSTPNLLSLRNRLNFLRGRMAHVIQPPSRARAALRPR
jgi:SAM-dependent methyltransferase